MPISPTHNDESVMSYICTGTATAVNWNPTNETALPMNSRRNAG
jgi:hypothetical protein